MLYMYGLHLVDDMFLDVRVPPVEPVVSFYNKKGSFTA